MANPNEEINVFQRLLRQLLNWVLQHRGPSIRKYVHDQRTRYPGASNEEIARKVVASRAFYSGVAGGVTGLGGFAAMGLTLPANLASSLAIQAEMMLAVAYIFGYDMEDEDRLSEFLVLLAGDAVKAFFGGGLSEAGKRLTREAAKRYFKRDVMRKIWKVVGRKFLTKGGEKSAFSIMKMVPLVGAPIGFGVDYAAARVFGAACIYFYRP